MDNLKFLKMGILILILVNIITISFIWFRPPPERGRKQVAEFLIKELALNKQQQVEFNLLKEAHNKDYRKLQKQGGELRTHFFSHLGKSKTDSAVVLLTLDSIASVHKEIEMLTFQHFEKVRALCDAQQQQKFDAVIQDVLKQFRQSPPPPKK